MSVQGSSRQSKAKIQADKNRLSQICLSIDFLVSLVSYRKFGGIDHPQIERRLFSATTGATFIARVALSP
jgi:hypothetical protein